MASICTSLNDAIDEKYQTHGMIIMIYYNKNTDHFIVKVDIEIRDDFMWLQMKGLPFSVDVEIFSLPCGYMMIWDRDA